MFELDTESQIYKRTFGIISVFILLVMLCLSRDYGINWDELGFSFYGEQIAKFYLSFGQDVSVLNTDTHYQREILYYGGFFEFVVWCLIKVTGFQSYLIRHGLTAFFGFLAILFTGLLAKELASWKTGILAIVFIFFTPVFLGNSMHNFKDIPFAASYIISIYYLILTLKELPKCSYKTIGLLTVSIGLAISLRSGGVIILIYSLLFWFIRICYIHFFDNLLQQLDLTENAVESNTLVDTHAFLKNSVLQLAIIFIGSYFIGILFWPYGLLHPFTGILESLKQLSNVQYWNGYPLFNGQWFNSWQVPWNYIPTWILITTPLFIPLSLVCLLIALFKKAWPKGKLLYLFVVAFTAVFPLVYVIIKKSNLYDSWRHLYFIYPPLVVIAAVATEKCFTILDSVSKASIGIFLLIFIADPIMFMARNYPNFSFYFSPIIGGVKGAFKNYEIDYYGTSLRAAVEWIAKDPEINKSNSKIKIKCWYGGSSAIYPFVDNNKNLEFIVASDNSAEWNYSLVPLIQAKKNAKLLDNWPPANTIHEIKVDEVPLVAIVKNTLTKIDGAKAEDLLAILKQPPPNATAEYFINLSLQLINNKDYYNAIVACEKAIDLEPKQFIAYNNMCIAYMSLSLFDEAIEAGNQAVKLNPQYQLAINNLNFALSQKDKNNKLDTQVNSLINMSLTYCTYSKYDKATIFAKKATLLQPNNSIAYNNLCVAYINLKQWDNAIEAGEKALTIDPSFTLAKNNLNWAKSQKK